MQKDRLNNRNKSIKARKGLSLKRVAWEARRDLALRNLSESSANVVQKNEKKHILGPGFHS